MEILELFKFLLSKKSVTPDDGGLLDFVEDYLEGFKALSGKRVGVFKNSAIHNILKKEKPDLKLILFTDDQKALEMIKGL